MPTVKTLTPELLKRLVLEEKEKMKEGDTYGSPAKEVDAKDYASTLEKHVNYAKKLGLQERILIKQLSEVSKRRRAIKKLILKDL